MRKGKCGERLIAFYRLPVARCLLLIALYFHPPVFLPVGFGIVGSKGNGLAIAPPTELVFGNLVLNQIIIHGLRPLFGEALISRRATNIVGMATDFEV